MGQSVQYVDCRRKSRTIGVRLPTGADFVLPLLHADWLPTT